VISAYLSSCGCGVSSNHPPEPLFRCCSILLSAKSKGILLVARDDACICRSSRSPNSLCVSVDVLREIRPFSFEVWLNHSDGPSPQEHESIALIQTADTLR
jgi:hypothetical protein